MREYGVNLREAASEGNKAKVEYELELGVPVDCRGVNYETALHAAAANGHVDVCKLLIERGADLEAKEIHGNTPMHMAIGNGKAQVVNLLLQHGAESFMVENNEGLTPYELAKRKQDSLQGSAVLAVFSQVFSLKQNIERTCPPKWEPDSSTKKCLGCSESFTTFRRKHHCRNCAQIYCADCSSKSLPIPKYGFDKPVRVCDSCFTKLGEFKPEYSF
eukprot:TRINITY_DN615_c0_g1_i1.p1 TRINITY_DN615_c0_g1~~TRINITY_DN615_c0_g1_i1.p1  ORF type:complete len:217 (+),score=33.81 TRINITY_DN615_c0_g1_i1:705-1355(+)